MSGWSRQRYFRVLRNCIEELLELLERILRDAVGCANPDARDDCLLDPGLVLFSKEANVYEVVERFAGRDFAVDD